MSLKFRLLLATLVVPWLLMALFAAVTLSLHHDEHVSRLEERLTRAVELLLPSLGEAVAFDDPQRLEAAAAPLLSLEVVRALGVVGPDGTLGVELGRLRSLPEAQGAGPLWIEKRDTRWQLSAALPGAEGDRLILDIDASPVILGHYRQVGITGLLLGAALLLLGGLFSVTYRRLQRPLASADEALARLALGESIPQQPLRPGELAGLTGRINALADFLDQARLETQRQIEQATAELEESMETIEVQNIELDIAHRRAVEANRIKSEFLANISHEIRTPLNGIIGFCHLLERSPLEPRQREWLDHVQRASGNLMLLVNDVLDFSRLEAGRLELERLPVDMVTLVDEVLALQAPLAHQKGLDLVGLVYDDVPASLTGDPMRIQQVLTNLVHNAVKFTEQGEVVVRVMVEQSDPGRVTLRITVVDTGIGLSMEHQRRLFQAFQQAEPSHSREFGGSGLGLTICRQLVEQMGGEIGVQSEPGQGATFSFTLALEGSETLLREPELQLDGQRVLIEEPHAATRRALRHLFTRWGAQPVDALPPGESPALLVACLPSPSMTSTEASAWHHRLIELECPALLLASASPMDLPDLVLPHGGEVLAKPVSRATLAGVTGALMGGLSARSGEPDGAAPESPPLRLLAVDDSDSNRLLLRELLAGPGLEMTLAASGEEALTLGRQQSFDLVLMDIRMPGMDGVETTRALRRLGPTWRRTPVVAVTAHVLEKERQRLLASGLDDVLVKPVDAAQLGEVLYRHLGIPPAEDRKPALPAPVVEPSEPARRDDGELPTVDLELGTRLAAGRGDLARQLLVQLAESLPESEAAIERALNNSDNEALLDAIHGLNGACRYCGAPRLGLIAESLETRLRTGGREGLEPLLQDLFCAMADLREWARRVAPASRA
ncbi:ATP-binding protein [Halomonas mongoliensis]|uniref:ATP-binding protein n=1 Tax=Halomonas mongoliensis TaxID=321265 RepID=UPI00403AA86B